MTNGSEDALRAQRRYGRQSKVETNPGLVAPEAFVRGIRHIGYRSNVEAIAELVDNSIQAYAQQVDLVLGFSDCGQSARPLQLAVIDDGHGMGPAMLRFAMMWGGTHRENDRSGLGRFGYGLPCATVSMGRRFSIYSKVKGGKVYAVSLDLDLLDEGAYLDEAAELSIPSARSATLPIFVSEAIARVHPNGWRSGTVVVIEKLDRLHWATAGGLRRNLVRQFGVAYHKLLDATAIHIDGDQVQPIDPLFLSPGCALNSLDEDRAHSLEPITLRVGLEDGATGEIVLRYAWLPPTFGAADKSRDAIGLNANARFPILKQYHGIVFSRNGRVIDVQSRTPWTTFINNDRYIRIEVEFSASLDEAFGVTTSKQQVSVSQEMWEQLQTAGLPKAIEHLRAKVRAAKAERQRAAGTGADRGQDQPSQSASSRLTARGAIKGGATAADASLGGVDPGTALDALLARIERRRSASNATIANEYDRLMRGWAKQLSRLSGTKPTAARE
jgi:Histidine kinase-, DNA gyrase B-, and HSP90-like ATPase